MDLKTSREIKLMQAACKILNMANLPVDDYSIEQLLTGRDLSAIQVTRAALTDRYMYQYQEELSADKINEIELMISADLQALENIIDYYDSYLDYLNLYIDNQVRLANYVSSEANNIIDSAIDLTSLLNTSSSSVISGDFDLSKTTAIVNDKVSIPEISSINRPLLNNEAKITATPSVISNPNNVGNLLDILPDTYWKQTHYSDSSNGFSVILTVYTKQVINSFRLQLLSGMSIYASLDGINYERFTDTVELSFNNDNNLGSYNIYLKQTCPSGTDYSRNKDIYFYTFGAINIYGFYKKYQPEAQAVLKETSDSFRYAKVSAMGNNISSSTCKIFVNDTECPNGIFPPGSTESFVVSSANIVSTTNHQYNLNDVIKFNVPAETTHILRTKGYVKFSEDKYSGVVISATNINIPTGVFSNGVTRILANTPTAVGFTNPIPANSVLASCSIGSSIELISGETSQKIKSAEMFFKLNDLTALDPDNETVVGLKQTFTDRTPEKLNIRFKLINNDGIIPIIKSYSIQTR